ncbi:MAG TPA: hypothetical protein VK005_01070 [Acholeplasma sp.]|nr:hypothetical protein [Acholeplasma sp.]
MRDELLYHEYAGWKLEHSELINNLKQLDSPLIIRFENVLNVIDHLYDKLIDDPDYSDDEDEIFRTGFYYVYDQIEEIKKILKDVYHNDYIELNTNSKKINLLLNTIDFQNELLSQENYDLEAMQFLLDFESSVMEKLTKKEHIDDSMYQALDVKTDEIFRKMNLEFYPIDVIFLEIADELGII